MSSPSQRRSPPCLDSDLSLEGRVDGSEVKTQGLQHRQQQMINSCKSLLDLDAGKGKSKPGFMHGPRMARRRRISDYPNSETMMTRGLRPFDGIRHRPLIILDGPTPGLHQNPSLPAPLIFIDGQLERQPHASPLTLSSSKLEPQAPSSPKQQQTFIHNPYGLNGPLEVPSTGPPSPTHHFSDDDGSSSNPSGSSSSPLGLTGYPSYASLSSLSASSPDLSPASSSLGILTDSHHPHSVNGDFRCSHPRPWRPVQVKQEYVRFACTVCNMEWQMAYANRHTKQSFKGAH